MSKSPQSSIVRYSKQGYIGIITTTYYCYWNIREILKIMTRYKSRVKHVKVFWISLQEMDLTPSEVLLLYLIEGLSQKKGMCYASKETLAVHLNVTKATIYSLLNSLENKALIHRYSEKLSGMTTTIIKPSQKWLSHMEELRDGGLLEK